jgi:hypothetical protein
MVEDKPEIHWYGRFQKYHIKEMEKEFQMVAEKYGIARVELYFKNRS